MTATLFCPFCGAKFATPQTSCTECGKQFTGQQRTMLGMSAKEILEQARKERESGLLGAGTPASGAAAPREGTPGAGTAMPRTTGKNLPVVTPSPSGGPADPMAATMSIDDRAGIAAEVAKAEGLARAAAAAPAAPAGPARETEPARGKEGKVEPAQPARAKPAEELELDEIGGAKKSSAGKWVFITLLILAVLGGGGFFGYTMFLAEKDFIVTHEVERKLAGEDDGHAGSAFVVHFQVDGAERPFKVKIGDTLKEVKKGEAAIVVPWSDLKVGKTELDAKIHGNDKTLDYPVTLVRPFSIEAAVDAAAPDKVHVSVVAAKGFKARVDGKDVALDKKKGTGAADVDTAEALAGAKDGAADLKIAYELSGEGKKDRYSGSITVHLVLPDVPIELVKLKSGDRISSAKGDVLAVRVKAPGDAEVKVNGKRAKKDAKDDVFEVEVKLVKGDNEISVSATAPRHKDAELKISVSYEG